MTSDRFEYLDHTADVLFHAHASTLEGLFVQAGLAVEETMTDLKDIELREERSFTLTAKKIDLLLFDFLDELLFYKDSELLFFKEFSVSISKSNGECILKCVAKGEAADASRHDLQLDVKAITLHMFELKQEENGSWFAQVLIDI